MRDGAAAVDDQHLGCGDQRPGEGEPPPHAIRGALHGPVGGIGQNEPLEELVGPAGVGDQQGREDPDGGRLAGAVRTEHAQDVAAADLEVEAVEGRPAPYRLTSPSARTAIDTVAPGGGGGGQGWLRPGPVTNIPSGAAARPGRPESDDDVRCHLLAA